MKLILLFLGVSVVFGDNSTGVGVAIYDEEKEPSVNTRRRIIRVEDNGVIQTEDNGIDTDFDPSGPGENRIAKDCARLYEHSNYQGDSYLLRGYNNDLRSNGWNDRISSIKIFAGCRLRAYDHPNYKGQGVRNPDISVNTVWSSISLNDRVSSVKCDCRKACAQVYEHGNYRGKSCMIQQGEDNPVTKYIGWDDNISSIRIMAGCKLKAYEHTNYKGQYYYNPSYLTYNIGWRSLPRNDRISSWKCECQ